MPEPGVERIEKAFRAAAAIAATAATLVAAFYFISWMAGSMTYLGLESITIKTNASLGWTLCGSSVLLVILAPRSRAARYLAALLAAVVLVIGLLTFLEHLFDWDPGIDQMLARVPDGYLGISYPNRMGPPDALGLTLMGSGLLLYLRGTHRTLVVSQWLGALVFMIGMLGGLAYLYGVEGLYGASMYTSIAWQITIVLVLLGLALTFLSPQVGAMAAITANDAGGVAIRRLLLPAIVVSVLLGWLVLLGEWYALYEHYFGTTILVVSWVLIFSVLICQTGKRVSSIAGSRQRALEELQRTQTMLLEAESLSHIGAWEWDLTHDVWSMSEEWLKIHGVSNRRVDPDELISIAHPDDRERVAEALEGLRKGERPYQLEHRIIRQDTGAVRIVKAQGQFVKEEGRVIRVYGFVQDVTEIKLAEEQLTLQRQLLESVVEHTPVGIAIVRGADLRVLMANPAYRQLGPDREMLGRSMEEVWPELPELGGILRGVLANGEPFHTVDQRYQLSRGPGQPLEELFVTWSLFRVQLPAGQGDGLLATVWETTARKRTEEALRDSERRLRSVIENLAEGLIIVDVEAGTLTWNRKALRMYQYSDEQQEIAHFETLRDLYELRTLEGVAVPLEQWPLKRVMLGQEFVDYELVVRDKRRNWQRTYSYSGSQIPALAGVSPVGLLTIRDITAAKQAEDALRASEELLRNILETLPVGVWILDADGMVTEANRAAQEIWGGAKYLGLEQFGEYKGWWLDSGKRIGAEEWGGARAISKGESSSDEVEIECFDGTRKAIINSSVPIRNERGEITGAITVNMDITSRKKIEAALRESEEKFRAVFEQAAVGIGRVRFSDARWIDVNDAFCRMLGYSRQYMLATPWPQITHPEDVDLDLIPFQQMAEGKLGSYDVEKRFIHQDGHYFWARLTLSLVRNPQGNPDYEIAIIEDITSRKEAEEALRQAKDELEQRVQERTRELEKAYLDLKRETEERIAAVEDLRKNEQLLIQQSRLAAMGEMLGNIAHQWRQPLNVLGLLIQQLSMDFEFGAFTQEHLNQQVAKAMQLILHMSQTITDFQTFLQQDKEKTSFDLKKVITTTLAMLDATLRTISADVQVEIEEDISITGHRNEFAQVVMNIITNARDAFRERKPPAPQIHIRLFREDGKSVVTIADNAGGIADDIIDKIFEPYFTTKGPDRGTGIGLFMSRNIIEKSMNGRLTVRNINGGAEFRIEI